MGDGPTRADALGDTITDPTSKDACDFPGMAETLSSLPALVLAEIWSQLSYASRRHLRATCRTMRLRIDADLIQTIVLTGRDTASSAVQPLLPPDVARAILNPSNGEGTSNLHSTPPASKSPSPSTIPVHPKAPVPLKPDGSLLAHAPETVAAAPAGDSRRHGGPTPGAPQPSGRFRSLRALVLTPHGSETTARCPHRTALPAALQPFLSPPPASLLSPFASCRGLTQLVLLDLVPGPAERDIAAIAAAFPALALLHILASPGCGARSAVPPLGALRACRQLRSLGLDLGRSSVMGSGARWSLGLLTQLTHLLLGLADTGGDDLEAVCCGTGGLAHAYHHYYSCHRNSSGSSSYDSCPHVAGQVDQHRPCSQQHHQQQQQQHRHHCLRSQSDQALQTTQHVHHQGHLQQREQEGQQQQAVAAGPAGKCTACGGGNGVVVAAMVGGVEASLYSLVHANLRSLELRVISFGSYERRLLQAVAAGSAAAAAESSPASSSATPPPATDASAGCTPGLRHLCLRLMPAPQHVATSCGCFAGGGSAGLGGAFGGGGLGGDDLAAPSASLSCIPLALGNAAAPQPSWAQPSEAELMLAALQALPGLRAVEVPEVLVAASRQLTGLTVLTALTELRIGGVVAVGVPAASDGPRELAAAGGGIVGVAVGASGGRRGVALPLLPGLRTLTVEAESLAYGGGGSVPWWSAMCPSLRRVSLALQYGGGGGALGGGGLGLRYDGQPAAEPLVAALAGVADVRLVVCGATRGAGPAVPVAVASAVGSSGLRQDLSVWVRRVPGLRHLELYLEDPAQLIGCISPDLLAAPGEEDCCRGPGAGFGGAGQRGDGGVAAGVGWHGVGCGGSSRGLQTLKLVTAAGWEAVGPAAAAAATECAAKLCGVVGAMLDRASPPLGCLCLSVPGLVAWEHRRWECGMMGYGTASPLEGLARTATARGTRLCLCSLGSEQRAGVLHLLESRGVGLLEGHCDGWGRRAGVTLV